MQTEEAVEVRADLPGVPKEDINVCLPLLCACYSMEVPACASLYMKIATSAMRSSTAPQKCCALYSAE